MAKTRNAIYGPVSAHALLERVRRERIYADPGLHAEWKEKQRARARAVAADPQKRARRNALARKWYRIRVATDPGRKAHARSVRLRKYRLRPGDIEVLLSWQEHLCPICRRPDPHYVDHDHVSGVVRGLLCPKCNLIVGLLETEPDRVTRASDYLRGLL